MRHGMLCRDVISSESPTNEDSPLPWRWKFQNNGKCLGAGHWDRYMLTIVLQAEQYVILEPFQTLSYQGHSLSFALAMAGDPSLSVSHSLEEQLGYCRWYTVTASKGIIESWVAKILQPLWKFDYCRTGVPRIMFIFRIHIGQARDGWRRSVWKQIESCGSAFAFATACTTTRRTWRTTHNIRQTSQQSPSECQGNPTKYHHVLQEPAHLHAWCPVHIHTHASQWRNHAWVLFTSVFIKSDKRIEPT